MVVISDTSVITYLFQLDCITLLKDLFQETIIPQAVKEELEKISSQRDILNQYDWIKVKAIENLVLFDSLSNQLDRGEAEAITLSLELNADILLIDEKRGRKIATEYGIKITGLIGVLIDGKQMGLIENVKPLLDRLIYEIGFRISPKLYDYVLSVIKED